MSTIFVSEATGKVGRHVVSGLLERGEHVRALVRDPRRASLPDGTKLVSGNIREPPRFAGHLDEVGALFLAWPFLTADSADSVVQSLASRAQTETTIVSRCLRSVMTRKSAGR